VHQIFFKPRARRDVDKLPHAIGERIARAIDSLAVEPRPPGCKKLAGEDDLWRIRIGNHRVVYQIQDDRLIVLVVRIGDRKDIYR
jgi:mRNA interferase RelE/StbE